MMEGPEGDGVIMKDNEIMDSEQKEKIIRDGGSSHVDGCDINPEAFQEVLNERKMELKRNAEKNRLDGLRSIADRKSKIGINPLERFPKEIWAKILEELRPEDRANMWQVHDIFRDLIESSLVGDILFPLVIINNQLPFGEYTHRSNAQELIHVLRSVSKSLRDGVDSWIEAYTLDMMRNPESNDRLLPRYHFQVESEMKMERLNRGLVFSRGSINLRPKRFLRRALQVTFWEPDYHINRRLRRSTEERKELFQRQFPMMKESITELLETVGDQILFFKLNCDDIKDLEDFGLSISEIYAILRKWLLLMPKLKWLKLHASGVKSKTISGINIVPHSNAMPTLKDLERVDLDVYSYTEDMSEFRPFVDLWDSILSANPQVKYHKYSMVYFEYERYADPVVLSLALETVDLGRTWQMWDLPLLQRVSSSSNWNLKQLKLSIVARNDDGVNGIFRCIEKFQALEDVSLTIDHVKFGEEVNFLRLPNLRKFKIYIGPFVDINDDHPRPAFLLFFSLQFLLHCGRLESIVFRNLLYDSRKLQCESDVGIMDFQGGRADLRESNIWNVFPKLKDVTVTFQERPCDRERRYYCREYCNRKLVREKFQSAQNSIFVTTYLK